jgi:hypothetical protein
MRDITYKTLDYIYDNDWVRRVWLAVAWHVCHKTPSDGTNLYRQNAKGQPGVWACAAHSKPVDDELVRIVAHLATTTPEKGQK